MQIVQPSGIDEQLAHVMRRAGFGPQPGDVERWREHGPTALIDALLSADGAHVMDEDEVRAAMASVGDSDDGDVLLGVVDRMFTSSDPLHERMTWYWHTHFTTSHESSDMRLAWQQHHLLRRMALGNFGELAREITTDAAMLFYLDGAGSHGSAPNENYAREFLELFTLGRDGGYTEDDVRAAARVFSGWHVDWETGEVSFDPETHYDRPVTFMGTRRRWTVDSLVGFVCAQPACHRHVVARLYHHLVGPDLSDSRRNELADLFADEGLEIRPLVAAMLHGDDFASAVHSRARQPIEWALGALAALGFESPAEAGLEYWHLDVLGQVPFRPPNVAGWPLDDRWGSPSGVIARTSVLLEWGLAERTIDEVTPTVDAVLARCGIHDPSTSTQAALDAIEADFSEFDRRLELLFVTALVSPEFTLT